MAVQAPFVFSNELKWRVGRHLCFWLCWYIFQVYIYSFAPSPLLTKISFWSRIQMNAGESLFYLLPHIFLSYVLMYLVIPKMVLRAKYFKAVLSILLLIIITAGLSAIISATIIESLRQHYVQQYAVIITGPTKTPPHVMLYMALLSGLRGSITIGGLAAAIKLMKHFYEKQQQALLLQQEKTVAELQTLKAQLHPHFLFNTLNNIYAHTQDVAPVATDMLFGLSALLRYMLYTCNAPLVPLAQEVSMMREYIELEKKRYGNKLEIAIHTPSGFNNLLIAPLLILPFIENCFKHGASGMLEHPWINIHISLDGRIMHLKLVNGKAASKREEAGGIGIANVRRRLQLLYAGKHQLSVLAEEEAYVVNLQLELTQPEGHLPRKIQKNETFERTSI